jgi:hypothetical protein
MKLPFSDRTNRDARRRQSQRIEETQTVKAPHKEDSGTLFKVNLLQLKQGCAAGPEKNKIKTRCSTL